MNDTLNAAYAAYQKGKFDEVRRVLAQASDGMGLHLRGLAEKRSGDLEAAAATLNAAVAAMPRNHEIHNNLGLTYRELSQFEAAASSFERALKLSPDFTSAKVSLARTRLDLRQWEDAYDGFKALTRIRPGDAGDAFGMASAGLEIGEVEQAVNIFNALIQYQDRGDYRYMRGRANLELQNLPQALEDFTLAHAELKSGMTLSGLVNLLWMTGDDAAFERTLNDNQSALPVEVAESWLLSGNAMAAQAVLQSASSDTVSALILGARVSEALEDYDSQIDQAQRALEIAPDDEMAVTQLVIGLFATGRNAEASDHAHRMMAQHPDSQHWLAYGYTAWRLGNRTHHELFQDAKSFVRHYQLSAPQRYSDLAAFNAALAGELEGLRRFVREPLNQSFKGGIQSARDLAQVKTGVVADYVAALDAPIRQYLQDIGSAATHPTTRLNRSADYKFSGMWSIEMKPEGRHVNHIHPEGWISSAYYVALPESVTLATDRAGWFHYGQPPHPTHPALEPAGWVAPMAGYLVLFPSWMWHGTTPFFSDERRLTAPFDLIPVL